MTCEYECIRIHVNENLSINEEGFQYLHTFKGSGGCGKANRAFDGKLIELVNQLNAALPAWKG